MILQVRLLPRSFMIPWSNGKDACVTCRKLLVRFQPGSLVNNWRTRLGHRRRRLNEGLHKFLDQYARKKPKRGEPNDRHYDRAIEKQIKRMSPEELDRLMRGVDDTDEEVADELDDSAGL